MEINYNWKCDQEVGIPQKHEEALKEDAKKSKSSRWLKKGIIKAN